MGIFDFIKDAGAKIFGKDDDEHTGPTKSFSAHIRDHGLDPSGLNFKIDGSGVLTVTGSMPSMEEKEKVVLIVGNVRGVSQVVDNISVAAVGDAPDGGVTVTMEASGGPEEDDSDTPWESRTYTVVSGDTLWKISAEMYGNGAHYMKIYEANKPMLSDPNKIYPGQVLRIPNMGD